jgi:hypothetical protein
MIIQAGVQQPDGWKIMEEAQSIPELERSCDVRPLPPCQRTNSKDI